MISTTRDNQGKLTKQSMQSGNIETTALDVNSLDSIQTWVQSLKELHVQHIDVSGSLF